MTGPLAQQIAQVREALEDALLVFEDTQWARAYRNEAPAALSVIERHVQDMETALTHIAEGRCSCGGKFWTDPATSQTRCENCDRHRGYGAPHYTIAIARAALPASGTRNPRNRVAREKGTE